MTNTKTKTLLKALLSATALTVFATGTAQAQDKTLAGTTVSNTFSLDYNVGGVAQPQIDSTATPTLFTVDRLVDLTVTSNGDTTVAPGSTDEELVFSVSNEGNDTQAYALTVVEETGTAGDTIDTDDPAGAIPTLVYYIDDGNGTFEPGGVDGAPVAYNPASPPELGPDEVLWVVVTQDIPTTATDGDQADLTLVADTLEPATSPNAGTPVTADGDGNSLNGAAENVLADGTGTANEVDNAGDHSATGTYIIVSADIAGDKVVTIHSEDGSTCATIPGTATAGYGIPGACVEYVISVENSGSAAATDLVVNDVLPSELVFAAAVFGGDFTGGSFTSPALPGANTGCVSGGCGINLTGATLPAPTGGATVTTGTVTIRAYVK